MRILWVLDKRMDISTSGSWALEMRRHLERRGHTVDWLIRHRYEKPDFGFEGGVSYVSEVWLPFGLLRRLWFVLYTTVYLMWSVLRNNYDVIVLDRWATALAGIPASVLRLLGLSRVHFVMDVRTPPLEVHGWQRLVHEVTLTATLHWACHFYDGITTITPALRRLIVKRIGLPEKHIGVWSTGVSLDLFDPEKTIPVELGGLDNCKILFYHGWLSMDRGIDILIQAMQALRATCPDLRLVLLGSGTDVPALKALASELDVDDLVSFLPSVPYERVPAHIARSDLAIIPLPPLVGWQVSSPAKLMEYLAMNKPVILSAIEAHRAVVPDGTAGVWFLPEVSVSAVVRCVEQAYNALTENGTITCAGRELLQRTGYTWDGQAERFEFYLLTAMRGGALRDVGSGQ